MKASDIVQIRALPSGRQLTGESLREGRRREIRSRAVSTQHGSPGALTKIAGLFRETRKLPVQLPTLFRRGFYRMKSLSHLM